MQTVSKHSFTLKFDPDNADQSSLNLAKSKMPIVVLSCSMQSKHACRNITVSNDAMRVSLGTVKAEFCLLEINFNHIGHRC